VGPNQLVILSRDPAIFSPPGKEPKYFMCWDLSCGRAGISAWLIWSTSRVETDYLGRGAGP
jgi:hypothetical protein